MTQTSHSVTVRRVLATTREQVFAAFTRSEALCQWFSPNPDIQVEVLAFKFELDGEFRLRFTMPGGEVKVVDGTYRQIAPPEQLAFSWMWQAPDPHADIATDVVVQFVEQGDSTEIILTHDKLPDELTSTRHGAGWEGMLDRLSGFLNLTSR
jgi:uncharacterized protein YndB with AHSA1/START domain